MSKKISLKLVDTPCRYGLVRSETCDKIEQTLISAGLTPLNPCSSCSTMESLDVLAVSNKNLAASLLDNLGLLKYNNSKDTDVLCPVTNEKLVINCSLKGCSLYTTYPGVNNCTLVYMKHNNLDSLSLLDLSLMLGIQVKTVSEKLSSILASSRKNSIKTISCSDIEPTFKVISSSVCYTCDKPVLSNKEDSSYFNYCSTVCEDEKPKEVALLETEAGADIHSILLWAKSKYSDLNSFQQSLSISSSLLSSLVNKFLGQSLEDLYKKTKPSQESIPLKIRLPRNFNANLDRIQEEIDIMYGSPTLDFTSLDREISLALK